jgi:hypothetical protein
MAKSSASALCLWLVLTGTFFRMSAEELKAGSLLEARLNVATGSGISRPGDRVSATIIAPVYVDGRIVIPPEATISGDVQKVVRLGLGLKHLTASIDYNFDTLRLPGGEVISIKTSLTEVETAKERVSRDGVVHGISPTANVSSSLASYAWPLLYAAPVAGLPVMAVKFLIARSPDSEILFPVGTEMILRVTEPVRVPEAVSPMRVARITPEDEAEAHRILENYPQRAEKGGKPSDLLNILFLGNAQQIDRAFRAAGWSGAERTSPVSIYRMFHCLVERRGYKRAPMGKLTLNGTPADATYQKSLNTFSRRHHLRLWKNSDRPDVWVSAATEDTAIRVQNMHLTHSIDPHIDDERAKVVNDLVFTGCVDSAALLPRSTVPPNLNEQGEDVLITDGSIAILRLNDCHASQTPPLGIARKRPSRLVQGLVALRKDFVRSNAAFVGYRIMKLAARSSSSSAALARSSEGRQMIAPSLPPMRSRSSIFDAANRPAQQRSLRQ